MKEYIQRRQDTIAEYIVNVPIYDICAGTEQMPGLIIFIKLWDQDFNLQEEGDIARKGSEREVG